MLVGLGAVLRAGRRSERAAASARGGRVRLSGRARLVETGGLRGEGGWLAGGLRLGLVTAAAVLFLVFGGWLSRASASDVYDSITVGGSSLVVTLSSSGDRGFITFSGTAGQYLGLGVSSNSISNLSVSVSSSLASGTVGTSGGEFDFKIPSTGTYTITVDPPGSSTGSLTLTLSEDVADTITAGGSSETLSMSRIGQNGRLTFSGSQGENLGVGFSDVSSTLDFKMTMYRSNGTVVSPFSVVRGFLCI